MPVDEPTAETVMSRIVAPGEMNADLGPVRWRTGPALVTKLDRRDAGPGKVEVTELVTPWRPSSREGRGGASGGEPLSTSTGWPA